ncbi:MAG: TetR/AcrR family transcriptional regulator [Elusimicrobia bacterium]|nr:TetR/AcrR family transcriptional regulator [Elusimicrobiota bacterium]
MGRKPNAAVRERILQEAEHVIHLKGYGAACMDEIAKASGMTKANLFHHFGSKSALALAVLDYKIEEFRSRKVLPLCAQAAPEEAVAAMFEEGARFFRGIGCRAGCFVGNIALEMSDRDEAFRERVGSFFAEWAAGMAECLERGKSSGYFRPSLDSRASAEAIVALYEGAIMLTRAQRDASIFKRAGAVARSILEQHKTKPYKGGKQAMGPKTPCGC